MNSDILNSIDARDMGRRLQEARKARGRTQQEVADYLGVARTTITAIEKGERRIQHDEFVRLAAYYGRSVGELLRSGEAAEPFSVQLRAVTGPRGQALEDIREYALEFQLLSEDYLELERICEAPMPQRYPPPYQIAGISPEVAAEDVANTERNRLGLGDGPILGLRDLLERAVGLRVFYMELPSRVGAMFAYTDKLGGCIAVNRKHPEERRRQSQGHEYGHFLSKRYTPEVVFLGQYQRQPEQERFADAFARNFLLPASGLRRHFNEIQQSRDGHITPADLCMLADFYFVSVEALTRRLEELRLIPLGTWDRLEQAGFRVRETQAFLNLPSHPAYGELLPTRYRYLAVEAYGRGDLSEGQLARYLRVDRLEARRVAAELTDRAGLPGDEDASAALGLDLGSKGAA